MATAKARFTAPVPPKLEGITLELDKHEADVLYSILYTDVAGTGVICGMSAALRGAGATLADRTQATDRHPAHYNGQVPSYV